MTRRARIAVFGAAGLLIAAGVGCAIVIGGLIGPLLALILIGTGLVLATSLAFLEAGLSEDRARASEAARLERKSQQRRSQPRPGFRRRHRRDRGQLD